MFICSLFVEVFLLHRTIKWIIAAALILSLCAASFAVAEESYYLELPSKGIESTRKISVNVPQENPVVDGINPLTGEVWTGDYRPIGVNIDQHPEALPNWGVASADIIFEMPIQADGSTLCTGLWSSWWVGVLTLPSAPTSFPPTPTSLPLFPVPCFICYPGSLLL